MIATQFPHTKPSYLKFPRETSAKAIPIPRTYVFRALSQPRFAYLNLLGRTQIDELTFRNQASCEALWELLLTRTLNFFLGLSKILLHLICERGFILKLLRTYPRASLKRSETSEQVVLFSGMHQAPLGATVCVFVNHIRSESCVGGYEQLD